MGPGPDGPMGAMGAMEPHHMNGSLGAFSLLGLVVYLSRVLYDSIAACSCRVWRHGRLAKGESPQLETLTLP